MTNKMIAVGVLGSLVAGIATAHAQPGEAPPYLPPASQYQPAPSSPLTTDEQALLDQGEIDDGRYYVGGLASVVLGLGIGQAVQGRWLQTGWIFTLGEVASFALVVGGLADGISSCASTTATCNSNGVDYAIGGALGLLAFHIGEIVDAFAAPPVHNRHVRAVRAKLGMPTRGYAFAPYVAPATGGTGGEVAGLTVTF